MSLQSQKLLEQQASHSIQPDSNHFNNNFEKKTLTNKCVVIVVIICVCDLYLLSFLKVLQQQPNQPSQNPSQPPGGPNSTKGSKHISLVDGSKSKAPWSSNTSFKVSAAFSTPGSGGIFFQWGKSELWIGPAWGSCKRGWCFCICLKYS